MAGRLASCDPCRSSKVACDHALPICGRCRSKDLGAQCSYRDRPFKRRRILSDTAPSEHEKTPQPERDLPGTIGTDSTIRVYPNPGYLGSSSHKTIFEKISASHDEDADPDAIRISSSTSQDLPDRMKDQNMSKQIELLRDIQDFCPPASSSEIIKGWLAKGTNLALAGVILRPCVDAACHLLNARSRSASELTRALSLNTHMPLEMNRITNAAQFCDQFCGANIRWETIGLFLIGLGRAACEYDRFAPLFLTRASRNQFRSRALYLADQCLETALATDSLNDLQVLLQYENWIAHATVCGDQGYRAWRKLGDVISSLYALGYHEQESTDSGTSAFLGTLRSFAFARAYSGDKNVSIFLGRPPRIHRKYCQIQRIIDNVKGSEGPFSSVQDWCGFAIETRWSATCAILKERILDLSKDIFEDQQTEQASSIVADSNAQWLTLPDHVRLQGPLTVDDERTPVHTDLLASMKLNHLHVLFLLRLFLTRETAILDATLVKVSGEILHLIAETVVLKEHLANSGTTLVWRLAYYGIPAAGILCLALLKNLRGTHSLQSSMPQVVQDLSILIAHMDAGTLITADDANYALLSGALGTVKNIVRRTLRENLSSTSITAQPVAAHDDLDQWMSNPGGWDFELDFWLHLAEHSELMEDAENTVETL